MCVGTSVRAITAPHHRRKSSGEELFLCLNGLAVAEGYVDVALAVYREVVGQGIEVVEGELGQLFRHLLEGGQEILDAVRSGRPGRCRFPSRFRPAPAHILRSRWCSPPSPRNTM